MRTLAAILVLFFPASAGAQTTSEASGEASSRPMTSGCTLRGEAQVDHLRPAGTDLALNLSETAEVVLRGRRADVRGLHPLELEGRATIADVHLVLARDRTLHGVLELTAGTAVRATSMTGGRARAQLDAGPIRVFADLRCEDVALSLVDDGAAAAGAPTATEPAAEPELVMYPRSSVLRVFATASGTRAITLRDRDRRDEIDLPPLDVLAVRGTRAHVRAELEPGVVLDGWVERATLTEQEPRSGCGRAAGAATSCGWSYESTVFHGRVTVPAGTELFELGAPSAEGPFAHTVADVTATVATSSYSVSRRWARPGEPEHVETEEHRTVYVDAIEGLLPFPCSGLGITLSPDFPTPTP